jgi:hypothetical protein
MANNTMKMILGTPRPIRKVMIALFCCCHTTPKEQTKRWAIIKRSRTGFSAGPFKLKKVVTIEATGDRTTQGSLAVPLTCSKMEEYDTEPKH